jgi:hypothetical protein
VQVLAEMATNGYENVQLARFSDADYRGLAGCLAESCQELSVVVLPTEEKVLDWAYPVYTLSTHNVAARTGRPYEQLRQRLHKIDRFLLRVETIVLERDEEKLLRLVTDWTSKFSDTSYTPTDLMGPTQALFRIWQAYPDKFSGQIVSLGGQVMSYCVWEKPIRPEWPANQLLTAASHDIKGASEWQMVLMCEELSSKNVGLVNIGGSEDHGLDRYKRKFSPIQALRVGSLKIHRKVDHAL